MVDPFELSQGSAGGTDLALLLEEVLAATMAVQGADFGYVQLHDETTGTLRIVAHRGVGPAFLEHFAAMADTSASGLAFQAGEQILIEDVETDPGYAPHRTVASLTGYRGVLCTALVERGSGKRLGVLTMLFRKPCRPGEQDLRVADLFARQAADLVGWRLLEQRRRDSEEYFRLAIAAGHLGIWEWDATTNRIRADGVHQALFGLPPEKEPRPNETYWARMDPEESQIGTRRASDALAAGSDIELELRVRPSQGVIRWISVRGRPRHGGAGSIIGISHDITERKKREEALRAHEKWLAAILDQVPGALGLFDKDGRLLLRGGPLGRMWDDIIPSLRPGPARRWRAFDSDGALLPATAYPGARALRGETVTPGTDFLHLAEDGTETWFRISAAPFRDEAGQIAGAVAILEDVNQEKQAEERLRQSEARLETAADLVGLGWYQWSADCSNFVLDARTRALWGLSPDAPVGLGSAISAVHPEDRHLLRDVRSAAHDPASGGYEVEYRVIGIEDGVERWVRARGRPFCERGKTKAFIGAVLDITGQKQTERALRENQARLQAAADLVKLGLYSWDPATNEVRWDAAVKSMWGIPPDGAVDWEIMRGLINAEDLPRVDAAIAGCIRPEGDGIYDIEYRVTGQDGVERWIATRGQTRFEDSRPVSFLGVAIDVTARKSVESRLEQLVRERSSELANTHASLAAEMKQRQDMSERLDRLQEELFHAARLSVAGEMAATIAHELSQPLSAVVNSVNAIRRLLVSRAAGAPLQVRELIEDAGAQAERAHQIVRRLRRFIRRGSPDPLPELVRPLVEEAVAFAMTGPESLGVSASCYFDPAVSTILADRVAIQQVISNLVRNSLQAMKGGRRRELTIATHGRPDGMVEIAVTDSGSGVEEGFRKNLFQAFQSTKAGGMGLGLSICRSIVEAHGGRLEYQATDGEGATFSFTIPQAGEAAAA
ncbi:MAG: two-component system, LuxR family, sensor kinase FixL [Sphingomonadales bacterium]|jgi:PAS domain S-box-containing protein|nr:two-component system, LuxR family, sensor kinase FixL [Sphingomonadales bacterium]